MTSLAVPNTFRVADIVDWQRNGNLELRPFFQRRSSWTTAAKAYLIDTVARGMPIPILLIRERTNLKTLQPIREVVDGQQRLRTLLAFVAPDLLPDFDPSTDDFLVPADMNPDIADRHFRELPDNVQLSILEYRLPVFMLPNNADDRLILDIFARLNSTGEKLNPQELRNARFHGRFKRLMYALASEHLDYWRNWHVFKDPHIARMREVEFTSDLAMLILYGVGEFSQKRVEAVYRDLDRTFPAGEIVRYRFRHVMSELRRLLDNFENVPIFRQKVWFYALFAYVYDTCFKLNSKLVDSRGKRLPERIKTHLQNISDQVEGDRIPDEIVTATRGRVSHKSSREKVLSFVRGEYA